MTPGALAALIARFAGLRVAVLGDVMLDEYVWGDVSRISPDAPVQVVEVLRKSHVLGGAGNVAANLAAARATPVLVGAVGADAGGRVIRELAAEAGVEEAFVEAPGRSTTVKTRVVARGQHLVRLDEETRGPLPAIARANLLGRLESALKGAAALVVSDYAKGVVDGTFFREAAALASRVAPGIPIVVDPKSPDMSTYRGATVVTPNRKEAEIASGIAIADDAGLAAAGQKLIEASGAANILITLGERGMAVVPRGGDVHVLPAEAREV